MRISYWIRLILVSSVIGFLGRGARRPCGVATYPFSVACFIYSLLFSLTNSQLTTYYIEGRFIRHRMFRDSCLPVEGNFLKDLSILGRDLSKAVLVDNSPHAFGYQVDNGIPIESWFDDPTDKELLKLELFLRTLHGVNDVREVVRKTFQTHRLVMDA